ncbi:hypothetical protein TcWFU_005780 [Taenia crassiceps]|uniref:Uncharacterized protein n=1 Tax=Taenia crassiceps TaxID=6207 RepID=A0ABR4QI45_9CEST
MGSFILLCCRSPSKCLNQQMRVALCCSGNEEIFSKVQLTDARYLLSALVTARTNAQLLFIYKATDRGNCGLCTHHRRVAGFASAFRVHLSFHPGLLLRWPADLGQLAVVIIDNC